MDRDILLILTGGAIGLVSSLATIFLTYFLDGLRLRRKWDREDQLMLKQKRRELDDIFATAAQSEAVDATPSPPVSSPD